MVVWVNMFTLLGCYLWKDKENKEMGKILKSLLEKDVIKGDNDQKMFAWYCP